LLRNDSDGGEPPTEKWVEREKEKKTDKGMDNKRPDERRDENSKLQPKKSLLTVNRRMLPSGHMTSISSVHPGEG